MPQRPQEIKQPTSVPCLGTKERSAPSTNPWLTRFPTINQFIRLCGVQLFAFERDARRFATLKSMLTKAGCRNVEPANLDFLAVQWNDRKYVNVTHM